MLSERKFEKEGLTFDDVLLIPGQSDVTPNMINLGTRLAGNITLKLRYDSSHGYRNRSKNGNRYCERRRNRYHS